MQTSMKLLLTAPPDQCRAALRFGLPVAHVAYRVGGGPHLFRASIPVSVRGGLMVIDNTGFDGRGEAGPFCQEVLRECMARGYDGILCDFEGHPLQVLAQAVRTLGELTKKRGWPLYVTEAYAPFSDSAVERVAEDFFLPSPTGQGMPLTREELRQRLEERAPSVFFSSELCAHYFTYMSRQNGAHFVLFDDAGSIRKKLQVARNLGISSAVLAYPQVDDLLPELLK